MTLDQGLAFGIIAATMAAFLWGKVRYDLVAVGALLVAVAAGVVKPEDAFSGFSNDIVIIVGGALVVSAAIARSGVMEIVLHRVAPGIVAPRAQLLILVGVVTALSAFVKNIGALAIMLPIAFQMARRSGVSPSLFLMPMAFGSLLGGLTTLIGTSPNVIVSRLRGEIVGTPFTMFDFAPVGGVVAVAGVAYLALFHWLLPVRRAGGGNLYEAVDIKNYTTEAKVAATSAILGKTLSELQTLGRGDALVTALLRPDGGRRALLPDAVLRDGDAVIIEGDPAALEAMVARGGLVLGGRRTDAPVKQSSLEAVEAVIGKDSEFIGMSAQRMALFQRTGVTLLAVSRRDRRFTERLGEIELELGDVILLQGDVERLPDLLRDWGCLPLVERKLQLGGARRLVGPLLILAVAMASTALGLVPVAVAFFAAAALMVALQAVPIRDVYGHLDAPILVMLAALIPISEALRTSGGTDVAAHLLSQAAGSLPPIGALGLILIVAMAVTPFLNNAATVLVMAPVAATFAADLGLKPDAFLMAVAIGAGCDFLTPIGHQCNLLVLGPGGYRFSDYARLGLPLSILVALVATPSLAWFWPLL